MNPLPFAASRRTALNPNAREFVPKSARLVSPGTIFNAGDETEPSTASDNGKTLSDKTGSSDTCTSDEESRRYWNSQLPDDILTPDTDFIIPSLEDNVERGSSMLRASTFESSSLPATLKDPSDSMMDSLSWERTAHYGKQMQGVGSFDFSNVDHSMGISSRHVWDNGHTLPSSSLSRNWNGLNIGNISSFPSQGALNESSGIDALSLLVNEFPSLPVQVLADVYQANGGDLVLTMRVLTQLKLQDNGGLWRNLPSSHSRTLDFSAPSPPELVNRLSLFLEEVDMQQPAELPRLARKNSPHWDYERNGLVGEFSVGPSSFSSTSPYASLFDGDFPHANDERLEFSHLHQKPKLSPRSCMEADDAFVNVMLALREEAKNHTRLRNAYAEQARQAVNVGNRILAKEATAKGQFHSRLMKAALSKAAEIELQRNISNVQAQSFGPGQTQLLDLRGLHVNEALNLLKRELSAVRVVCRSSRQHQQVFISVGTGHHRGTRTPARLLFAVKRHLAEEELLSFTEPQPGILKVLVS